MKPERIQSFACHDNRILNRRLAHPRRRPAEDYPVRRLRRSIRQRLILWPDKSRSTPEDTQALAA